MKDLVLDHFQIETVNYDGGCWIECMECRNVLKHRYTEISIPFRATLTDICSIAEEHWGEVHCD